jgi:hypothetical protein
MQESHAGSRFPLTRRSVLLAAGDADPRVRRQAWETSKTAS